MAPRKWEVRGRIAADRVRDGNGGHMVRLLKGTGNGLRWGDARHAPGQPRRSPLAPRSGSKFTAETSPAADSRRRSPRLSPESALIGEGGLALICQPAVSRPAGLPFPAKLLEGLPGLKHCGVFGLLLLVCPDPGFTTRSKHSLRCWWSPRWAWSKRVCPIPIQRSDRRPETREKPRSHQGLAR